MLPHTDAQKVENKRRLMSMLPDTMHKQVTIKQVEAKITTYKQNKMLYQKKGQA